MNVTELIDTISQFAFGTLATERQRSEYLRCLNFANNDIYLRLRNYKSFLIYKEQKVIFADNIYSFQFDFKKGIIKSIYNKDSKLGSFDLLTNDNLNINENQYFSVVSDNKIILGARDYNKDVGGDNFVKMFYLPQLKSLVEVIDNVDNETDTPIYDNLVNQCLILGSVYYIFLTTNGQINKLSSAYKLYTEKLSDVVNFYTSF
jgi:hypothetical protein